MKKYLILGVVAIVLLGLCFTSAPYQIFTDHGVYRNDDAFWHFKYNSSDVYGFLDNGKRYDLKVYGWRIPILTMYPNIIKATEVKQKEKNNE